MKQALLPGLLLFLMFIMPLEADVFAGGSGTLNDPWLVQTAEHLNALRNYLGSYNHYFKQIADIDLNVAPFNQGSGWIPIGPTTSAGFRGSYDGDNYSISGLYINNTSSYGQGLFGYAFQARFSNIQLTGVNINGGTQVGALVGYGTEDMVVANCSSSGSVTGSNVQIGGLVGKSDYGSSVINSSSTCTVSGHDDAGGLIGRAYWYATTSNCHSGGIVTGNGLNLGGLIGLCNYHCDVDNSYSTGSVIATSDNASGIGGAFGAVGTSNITNCYSNATVSGDESTSKGGLIGTVSGPSQISACFATGDVTARAWAGGFVGHTFDGPSIQNCFASGNVTILGQSDYACGGFVGTHQAGNDYGAASITNCYSTGSASGPAQIGGFVGRNVGGTITSCYSTGSATGISNTGGFCGYSLSTSAISDCYSSGSVNATNRSGGFIGSNSGTSVVSRSYNYGPLTFSSSWLVGGFAGDADPASIIYCYWDTEATGIATSPAGEGKTTTEMTYPYAQFTYISFNFQDVWGADYAYAFNNGYPFLNWRFMNPPVDVWILNSAATVQLNWSAVPGAHSYKIYASTEPFSANENWVYLGTTAELTYLQPAATKMFYRVVASSLYHSR